MLDQDRNRELLDLIQRRKLDVLIQRRKLDVLMFRRPKVAEMEAEEKLQTDSSWWRWRDEWRRSYLGGGGVRNVLEENRGSDRGMSLKMETEGETFSVVGGSDPQGG